MFHMKHEPTPCPFCRSTNLQVIEAEVIYVSCDDCGAEGPYHKTDIDLAIDYWDSRPPEGAPQVEMPHGEDD
jgi:hypothetical protein